MEIKTLQIYYDSFINQNEKRYFLRGMADYIELILRDKSCKKFISDIDQLKREFLDKNLELNETAKKKSRVYKKEFKDVLAGSEFSKSGDFDIDGNVFYLKNYPEVTEIERKIKDGQGTTLWEAWNNMCLAYLIIFKKEDVMVKPEQQDEYDAWILKNNPDVANEVKQVESFNKNGKNKSVLLSLDKKDYKPYVVVVHNYLIRKLDEKPVVVDDVGADVQADESDGSKLRKDGLQDVETIMIIIDKIGGGCKTIWLVFNNDFSNLVKFNTAGKRGGESYIMALYKIRDRGQVVYQRKILTAINSKIFDKKGVAGKYRQIKIVEKGDDGFFRLNDKIKVSIKRLEFLNQEQRKYFPADLKFYPIDPYKSRPRKNDY